MSRTDPGGSCPTTGCTTATYDAADRMTSIDYSDPATPDVTSIAYDDVGRGTSMTDGTGTSTWAWDSLGRLTSAQDGAGSLVSYAHANLRDPATYPGNRPVTHGFDAAGNMISVSDWLNNTTTFTPDADSNVSSATFPAASGLVDSFDYDDAGALMSIANEANGVTRSSLTYGRNDDGQVSSVASSGQAVENHSYTYTPLNQLAGLDASTYEYDAADNLVGLASGPTMTYGAADQLEAMTRPPATTTFSYDDRGNRTSATPSVGPGSHYSYDQARRLISVSDDEHPESLAGGWYHSLAASTDGTLSAWGYNGLGQLGDATTTDSTTAVAVVGLGVTAVAGGAYNSLALRAGGTVWAWGWNAVGQLGDGTTVDSHVPVQVHGLSDVVAIVSGGAHNLALRGDGSVWSWGLNDNGQLGDATTTTRLVPVQVTGLPPIVDVAGGHSHSLALAADGSVWAWGYNGYGNLGDSTTTDVHSPTQVLGGARVLSAGAFSTFAILGEDLFAWGWNAYGQLGNANSTDVHAPAPTTASGYVGMPATLISHGLALRADGTVASWGYNGAGMLGDGTLTDRHSPVSVAGYDHGDDPLGSYAYDGDGLRMSKTVAGGDEELHLGVLIGNAADDRRRHHRLCLRAWWSGAGGDHRHRRHLASPGPARLDEDSHQ